MAFDHVTNLLPTLRGGVSERKQMDGSHAYVSVGNGYDEERVTIWAENARGLAAALRRAAAEIEIATYGKSREKTA